MWGRQSSGMVEEAEVQVAAVAVVKVEVTAWGAKVAETARMVAAEAATGCSQRISRPRRWQGSQLRPLTA